MFKLDEKSFLCLFLPISDMLVIGTKRTYIMLFLESRGDIKQQQQNPWIAKKCILAFWFYLVVKKLQEAGSSPFKR